MNGREPFALRGRKGGVHTQPKDLPPVGDTPLPDQSVSNIGRWGLFCGNSFIKEFYDFDLQPLQFRLASDFLLFLAL